MAKKQEAAENKKAFDLESVYDSQIAPLMSQIIDICKEHKLPMFATFLCANDSKDSLLATTNLMFKERPIPDEILQLLSIVKPSRGPAVRMRVTKGDGTVEDTLIIP